MRFIPSARGRDIWEQTMHECHGSRRINAADAILGPTLARGHGNDIAILFGQERLTYDALNAQVNRFGNALRAHLSRADRAILLLKDSPDFVAIFLGIIRIGAVAVPLNTRATAKELGFAIADSDAKVLFLDDEFLPLYEQARAVADRGPDLVVVRGQSSPAMVSIASLLADASSELQTAPTDSDDMAFWLYTSGTTGSPKGAVHRHGDVTVGDYYMQVFGFGRGERVFSSSKLFFTFALGHVLIGALRTGCTIILYDGWPDGAAIADVVDRYRPTIMLSVPAFYRTLLHDGFTARPGFGTVRIYLSAGEALPESLYRRWREVTGVAIVEGIGATESIFMIIGGTPTEHRPGATGKPLPYAEVKLVSSEGNPVTATDMAGILWVRMGSLCHGYWQKPDKTEAAFRDGWFRTGDVFTVDSEGWWHHQGRADDLIKISGQWVSPAEIEECAASIPGIAEAVVVGSENEDGLVRLSMFLVAADGDSDSLQRQVQEKLLSTLSKYKCPRRVMFIDAIPRTATGKARRFRLREWLTARYLQRRMTVLGIDPVEIESTEPQLLRDLQRKCVACENQPQCLDDLGQSIPTSNFLAFCPNAEVLVSLRMSTTRR
jgi:benzoate-CoA ligase